MENLLGDPEYKSTLYVDRVIYDESARRLSIAFNNGPEAWELSHELIFEGITYFSEEALDEEDYPGVNNFTDTVIGFDIVPVGYCLHLTTVEYVFKTKSKPKIVSNT